LDHTWSGAWMSQLSGAWILAARPWEYGPRAEACTSERHHSAGASHHPAQTAEERGRGYHALVMTAPACSTHCRSLSKSSFASVHNHRTQPRKPRALSTLHSVRRLIPSWRTTTCEPQPLQVLCGGSRTHTHTRTLGPAVAPWESDPRHPSIRFRNIESLNAHRTAHTPVPGPATRRGPRPGTTQRPQRERTGHSHRPRAWRTPHGARS